MVLLSLLKTFSWQELRQHPWRNTAAGLALLLEDSTHSQIELRMHALGRTDQGRALHITFTLRQSNQLIRVISARDMHKKERLRYEQE